MTSEQQHARHAPSRKRQTDLSAVGAARGVFVALIVLAMMIAAVLHWGGAMLMAETLPTHADVAVVLQGSEQGQNLRLKGAMKLAQEGRVSKVLVSLPPGTYWGVSVPVIAERYIRENYSSLWNRIEFCITTPDVNSTEQEAAVLIGCIRRQNWQSIVVVTSNYHTRRAELTWRRVLRHQHFSNELFIHGVADPDFHAQSWWRERLSAKTWFFETTKLIWTLGGFI